MRQALARLVAYLHTVLVVVFGLGWLLPWTAVHWLVIGGGIAMQLSWWLLDGDCVLTRLERYLERVDGAPREEEAGDERRFVTRLVSGLLNRPVPDGVGNLIVYVALYTSMSICAVRLALGA